MTYALRDYERKIIKAALGLANCRPKDARKMVSAFMPLCTFNANVEDLLLPDADSVCIEHRQSLLDWFERITTSAKERRAVTLEVNPALWDAVELILQLTEKKGFRYIETQIGLNTFPGALAMATALILDDSYGLANRLKQCGNPKCGKFNLDLKPHGRPRTHCNAACKKAADATTSAERSRRHREKKAKSQKKRGK